MADKPDERKVVPGSDVEFAESTMRPDAVLEEVVRSPQGAEKPSPSFVNEALHRYVEYVASTRGPRMTNKFDPANVTPFIGYFVFNNYLTVVPRSVPKPELIELLRGMPDVAFLLDHSDLADVLPDSSDLINSSEQLKNLGYVPRGDVIAFNNFRLITGVEVLIPVCFLPLVIEDGERYHRFLGEGGKKPYFYSDHRTPEKHIRTPPDYDALSLTRENLRQFVERTGETKISGFLRQLESLHKECKTAGFSPEIVALQIYHRLKQYHPELTV